jgi:thiamine biosynthesis protein ThiS
MDLLELTVNGEARSVPAPLDLAGLLAALGIDPRTVAVELNRQIVPRAEFAGRALAAGDRLEIIRLVGGG